MKLLKITALIVCAVMLLPALFSCGGQPAEKTTEKTTEKATENATEKTEQTSDVTAEETAEKETEAITEKAPDETEYKIPNEDLTGMNTSDNSLDDDGNGGAIFDRLKSGSYFGNENAAAADLLDRASFAKDIVKYSGFAQREHYYICQNDYSDLTPYSQEMKFAEIAVNQGFMIKPAAGKFRPAEPVTYGEVLRGLLYALGYRDYADKNGVAKVAAEAGVSDYMDLSKKNSDTLTYAEYAQLLSNTLKLDLVLCIEKDGAPYIEKRADGYNIKKAYLDDKASEEGSIFRLANKGWDIFNGTYRYGPSMIINDDGSIDCWLAGTLGYGGEADVGVYRKSYDNGLTWTPDVGAVRPTVASENWHWNCDPGAIKIGDYYYITYTSILWSGGVDNNLFVARAKDPAGTSTEKWGADGWGSEPRPIVAFDGLKGQWGAGEGSMVVLGDTLYLYVTWAEDIFETRIYTADATSENWPETLRYRGIAYRHDGLGEDSADFKYVDAYKCFVSVAAGNRFSDDCYVHVNVSYDGIYYRSEIRLKHKTASSLIESGIHNMGITGDASGHIDIYGKQHFIGYAYAPAGSAWGVWGTRLAPIQFIGSDNYDTPEKVISRQPGDTNLKDTEHAPDVSGIILEGPYKSADVPVRFKGMAYNFTVMYIDKNGDIKEAGKDILEKIEYTYDHEQVEVDGENHTVTLIGDKLTRVYAKYGTLTAMITVIPNSIDREEPVAFYPEKDTIVFYYKDEVKQPEFIAKSAGNDFLVIWGKTTELATGSSQDLKYWKQSVKYSGYDTSIIEIGKDGVIKPLAVGETTVTATYMGLEAKLKVIVANMG